MIKKLITHLYSKYCEKDVESYVAEVELQRKHSDTRCRELQAKIQSLSTEIRMLRAAGEAGTVCPFAGVILQTFADSEEDADS